MINRQNLEYYMVRLKKEDLSNISLVMMADILFETIQHMEDQDRRIGTDTERIARLTDENTHLKKIVRGVIAANAKLSKIVYGP